MVNNKALPNDVAIDTITVYNYYKLPNGKETYQRTVLEDVYYRETSIDVFNKTGNEVDNTVIIKVNHYENYVPKNEWLNLSDKTNKFTFDNSISGRSTIIIKGVCAHEFDELEPEELSKELSNFLNNIDYRLVNEVKDAFYGSKSMWHSTIKC